jgi:hypothetical protein
MLNVANDSIVSNIESKATFANETTPDAANA